jgi:hypothetical protein
MSDPTLSIRSERIACTDGLPMLSAHRCATRMCRSRESSSDSGYLKERPQGLGPVPAQIDGACDAATHDQPRCVEVLLIANARRSSNRQPPYDKSCPAIASTITQPTTALDTGTPRWMQVASFLDSDTSRVHSDIPYPQIPRRGYRQPMVMSLLRAIVLRLLKWQATEVIPIALQCCCRSNHLRAASAKL